MHLGRSSVLKRYAADLHIHTCLSPCADWEMSPQKIVSASLRAGLDLIAVCDHNSAENAGAVMRQGSRFGLRVLPGMEICSREEVHLLAIFEDLDSALEMQIAVYANLDGQNNPDVFGCQVVANENDQVLEENTRLLIGATRLNVQEISQQAHHLHGLCLAAHVDRQAFGIMAQLGFIPKDLALDAVEVTYRLPLPEARQRLAGIGDLPAVTSSDAHYLQDIGRACTVFEIAEPCLAEIRLALNGLNGRKIVI
jgi:predicted metal-dependent phosphoesterase TrpH